MADYDRGPERQDEREEQPVGVYNRPQSGGTSVWTVILILLVLALLAYLVFTFVL